MMFERTHTVKSMLAVATLFLLMAVNALQAGVIYPDPVGGWDYLYTGAAAADGAGFTALDGTWSHDDGSDAWDGSSIGTGRPGGASALVGGDGTTYLRIQDPGDPRDYGMPDPSNRKLYFGHDITAEGAANDVLDTGVTLTFRARIATSAPLDDAHPDGGGGIVPWPAGGDGSVTHDSGKGNFSIKQASGGVISFALANQTEETTNFQGPGLAMNHLSGTAPSGDVDWQGNDAGTVNLFPVADPTAWHEFWVTIAGGGAGTHQVNVYADGSLTATTFDVTSGTGSDFGGISYIALGAGSTPQSAAIDIDFFGWKSGVHAPVPEPSGLALVVCGGAYLLAAWRRKRR